MVKTVHTLGGYYTIMGAAKEKGATYWEVLNFIKRNSVPAIRVGRTVMVRLEDLGGLVSR